MKIAIMQPYFFPYLGYFQLIQAVDVFVFYDDVNFIKKGWINRNRILLNNEDHLITIPCIKVSQNKLINEVLVNYDDSEISKMTKTLNHAYHLAPNFKSVMGLFEKVMGEKHRTISELAIQSVKSVCEYLEIEKSFKTSSCSDYGNRHLIKGDRLMDIAKREGLADYVNAIGGSEIYTKEEFARNGIRLEFLKPALNPYAQRSNNFVSGLSILDALMFERKDVVKNHLINYSLI